jgi:hypothetical protein
MNRRTGTVLLTAALGLAGGVAAISTFADPADAGTLTYRLECAPNGDTIVYLTAIDGGTTIYINGIKTSTLVVGPGTHTAEFWGYPTSDGVRVDGPDVLWGTATITVAPSNCPVPTTTTQAAPTTSEATTSTAPAPVPSTAPPATQPPDIDQGTTVPPVANTLPATA